MTEDSRGMGDDKAALAAPVEREAIARIIDNGAFVVPKHPAPDDDLWRGQRRHAALNKAGAILAALTLKPDADTKESK